jgi:flagellar biosynthesis protein FlhF
MFEADMESMPNKTENTEEKSPTLNSASSMRIKKFIAPSMKEAMCQIKKEMGDGAIILKSQRIPNHDLFSFLSREKVEVLAALEPVVPESETSTTEALPGTASVDRQWRFDKEWEIESVKDEIRSIRTALEEITNRMKYQSMPALPRLLTMFYQSMVGGGLEEKQVLDLVGKALVSLSGDQLEDRKAVSDFLSAEIAQWIPTAAFVPPESVEPQIIALVGPTGMGKTTSLSKLLTNPHIFRKRRMAVITVDTYRIGATEQLKRVTDIARVPLVVAYKPSQMLKAIQVHHDKDIIFIDTAGRSPNNRHHLQNLKEFMNAAKPDEVHLVLAANTRLEDMKIIADQFNQIPFHRYLFTKLDETSGYGNIINEIKHREKPLSFLAFGQKVPEEIRWAKSLEFARMFVLGKRYGSIEIS